MYGREFACGHAHSFTQSVTWVSKAAVHTAWEGVGVFGRGRDCPLVSDAALGPLCQTCPQSCTPTDRSPCPYGDALARPVWGLPAVS